MSVEVSDDTPVENREQLIAFMAKGCKPKENWRIGTEHEKFVVRCKDHKPAPYEPDGIGALLEKLQQNIGWDKVVQEGKLIGLREPNSGAAVSLEPGGQFELSGAPLATLHEMGTEISAHYQAACEAARELDLGFLGFGFWPAGPRSDMPQMPKLRYKIMTDYMQKVGTMGLDMMYRTCTVQVNLDFSSEQQMAQMMRIGMALQPVASALFAASPFENGKPNGYQTIRPRIWANTDPARCGILPFVFESDFGFARYVDWALDVPMYFVKRGEIYHDVTGVPFRALLEGKVPQLPGERATVADWWNHLGTLFPEVRLKHFIEMRGADAGPIGHIKALPALWTGLLYDDSARNAAFDLIKTWTYAQVNELYASVPGEGFSARINGRLVLEVARDIVALAAKGLKARARKNAQGENEDIFLEVLKKRTASGRSLSDELLEKYASSWSKTITPLFGDCALSCG